MTRRLTELSEHEHLVRVGSCWWGELYWIEGGGVRGREVRVFRDPALKAGYASLHEEAFCWAHADPDAWLILVIAEPAEVGEDFVMMTRRAGVMLASFYPESTDDPVEPPTERIELLHATVARMSGEARTPRHRFLAHLVERRVAARDWHVVYDVNPTGYGGEYRFYVWDLDPNREELEEWIALYPPDLRP